MESRRAIVGAEIRLDGAGAATKGADPGGDVFGGVGAAGVVDNHVGPGLGEGDGEGGADAAGRAGDECAATGEIKGGGEFHCGSDEDLRHAFLNGRV